MAQPTILINSEDKTSSVLVEGCSIEYRLAGRGTLRLTVVDETDPYDYRPGMLKEVSIAFGGSTLFAGLVTDVDETALVEGGQGVRSSVSAEDYSLYATRVYVNKTYAADRGDKSIKYIVSDLRTTYLAQYNITLDMPVTTPDILGDVVFEKAACSECLDHVCALTGWIWYITTGKVLKCHAPGGEATPATLTTSNSKLVSWSKQIGQYRNKETVYYTGGSYTANNLTEQGLYGVFEHVTDAPDNTTSAGGQELAEALIRMYANFPKVATLTTYVTGFRAGQQGTVTINERGINGSYLMQSVRLDWEPGVERFRTTVEAVEGDERTGSWIDLWKSIFGGGLNAAAGGHTVGGQVITKYEAVPVVFFLGGSRMQDVQGAGTWDVPDYIDMWLDGSEYPVLTTRQVRVSCRSLNGSTSITPRWYNVTDNQENLGAPVTSASWQNQVFSVTLASGLKQYRLQMVVGDSNGGVQCIGSLQLS